MSKYSLTDVILQGPSLQDTCVSDSKLSEKHEQKQLKKNPIRRIQSDFNITNDFTLTETPLINDSYLTKKSKSMIEIRSNINPTIAENNQAKISSPADMPIPGCRSILQMLEHVFADDEETSDMITEQPESLEPLLPNKRSFSNDQRYSTKLIEQQSDQQDESTIPTRFRRTHSNQGRRRHRTSRRATCKEKSLKNKMISFYYYLAVDQRQLYFNSEHNSNHHLSPSSSYRRAAGLMKGERFIRFHKIRKCLFVFRNLF
jgi:hypothetical protein